ncbi:3-oxoacyl-ACP synthase III family protein [Actinomadura sp. GTD37]|uniref:3-oxoacyl-ACP synthase III family protein n=1 Tax=Actinomadura sp. GTD37 TaxID=1778030 RepID=UPI0035C0264B
MSNAMLTKALGMSPVVEQWIDAFIGTRTRHLAVDLATGQVNETLTGLGAEAGERALAAAGIGPGDIDLVVMGVSMPDALMPATVNMIADRLRIDGVPTYQLQSGCTGAMQALDVARQMLLGGRARTALVIGGDVCAKHVDLTIDYASLPPSEMVNTVLFGDGAGAAVLTTVPGAGAVRLHPVLVRLTGLGVPPGQTVEWFGLGDRRAEVAAVREDYAAIASRVPVMAAETFREILDARGWAPPDLGFVLPPQLSVKMTQKIMEGLGAVGAEEISCVGDIGNTGNALPFFQLELLLPRMRGGDRAVAVSIESSKWIKAGFSLEKTA